MTRLPLLLLVSLLALLAACSQHAAPLQQVALLEAYPANGATDVPVDVQIRATFDGPIDDGALLDELRLAVAEQSVEGDLIYDEANFALVFTPAADLAPATTYRVTIAGTLKALQGAALGEAAVWSFTTAAAAVDETPDTGDDEPADTDGDGLTDDVDPDIDGDGLDNEVDGDPMNPDTNDDGINDGDELASLDGILAIDPAPGSVTTDRASLSIVLDRAIDPSTLELDTSVLVYLLPDGNEIVYGEGTDAAPIPGTLSYDEATNTLSYDFAQPLPATPPWFWVFLELDVVDTDGIALQVSHYWRYMLDPSVE